MRDRARAIRFASVPAALVLLFLVFAPTAAPAAPVAAPCIQPPLGPDGAAAVVSCTPTGAPPTFTPTPTRSRTSTPTLAPSPSTTPTRTATSQPSPSSTPTRTQTSGPSSTPTPTTSSTSTPTRTATGGTPTPTSTPTVRPPSPTPTYTVTTTYTYTYTYTPTRYYTYTTPTYTATPTRTPTVTPTPECEVTWEKVNFRTIPGNGGIGHFHLATKGCQGKVIQLKIERTAGAEGSAVFLDPGAEVMAVVGDVDRIVKVKGLQPSDVAYNMKATATNPVTGAVIGADFVVFWTEPDGQFDGGIPDEATGADGPIRNKLMAIRFDGLNQLGVAEDKNRDERGYMLMHWAIQPPGLLPWDFRSGGPGDGFDAKRRHWMRLYVDGCPVQAVDDQAESSGTAYKSLIPSFSGNALQIFDFDAPSSPRNVPVNPPPQRYIRSRARFLAWSVYTDDDGVDRRVSTDYPWFFRGSLNVVSQRWESTAPNDNEVGAGSTPLTYNLDPPPPGQNFVVRSFTPGSAPNSQPEVEVTITGSFPDIPGDSCKWLAYLIAPGDPAGNPEFPDDAIWLPGTNLTKTDTQIVVTFALQRGPSHFRGRNIPVPAKRYRVRVVRGTEYRQAPMPFIVTENPFAGWVVDPFAAVGPPGLPPHPEVTLFVYAVDAQGNVVSRPGQTFPTITVVPKDVPLWGITPTMGPYGEYYIQGMKVVPASSGIDNVTATGSGATASTDVAIPK
jgi:hypothetical protein